MKINKSVKKHRNLILVILDIIIIALAYCIVDILINNQISIFDEIHKKVLGATIVLAIIIYQMYFNIFDVYKNAIRLESGRNYLTYVFLCVLSTITYIFMGTVCSIGVLDINYHILSGIMIALLMITYRVMLQSVLMKENYKEERRRIYIKAKRTIDFFLALTLIALTSIPMLLVAIAIKIEDGGKVIYKSKRMGMNLKPFNVYKFRSMQQKRKELHSDMNHEEMVTKVGKFIRKTSLDELPQLFNILVGDMSFIGPRPWITEYYQWFTPRQKRRVNVAPGITGLAQAKGRNGISIFKKIDYDLEYVENISLLLDIKVIIWTIQTVLSKNGAEISEQGIKEEINQLKNAKEENMEIKV